MNSLAISKIDSLIENEKHRLIIKLVHSYKLTPAQIVNSKHKDLSLENYTFKVTLLGKSTIINLSEDIREDFKSLYEKSTPEAYLFTGRDPSKPMSKKNIHKICEKALVYTSNKKLQNKDLENLQPESVPQNFKEDVPSEKNQEKIFINPTQSVIGIRSDTINYIHDLANRGRHVLLVGPIGIGKSHILKSLILKNQILFIDDLYDLKTTLINWLLVIHNNDKKTAQENLDDNADTPSVKYLQRTSIMHLLRTILENVKEEKYTIVIDTLDNVTPRAIRCLDVLKSKFNIVSAVRHIPKNKDSLLWNFDIIDIKPLSKQDSNLLITQTAVSLNIADATSLEKVRDRLISSSSGNPRILIELLKRTFLEAKSFGKDSSQLDFDSLSFNQEKSILPIILIMAIILLPLRYVASITENSTHRMIGTIALVVFILFRYLGRYVKW
jgi:hypothetical protein